MVSVLLSMITTGLEGLLNSGVSVLKEVNNTKKQLKNSQLLIDLDKGTAVKLCH